MNRTDTRVFLVSGLSAVPAMSVDYALTFPPGEMADDEIDDARRTLGSEKLRIRLDARGRPPFPWESEPTFERLRPYTMRIKALNREMEFRQCQGRRPA